MDFEPRFDPPAQHPRRAINLQNCHQLLEWRKHSRCWKDYHLACGQTPRHELAENDLLAIRGIHHAAKQCLVACWPQFPVIWWLDESCVL